MELVVLGSGTAIPHPYRNPTGFLVRSPGLNILVDTGPGTIHRLPRVGVKFQEIQEIFYTHVHPDHFLDIIALLFAKRLPGIVNAPSLTIRGGPGLADLVNQFRALLHPWLEPVGYDLQVKEYRSTLKLNGWIVRACPLRHHTSSLAYRFEDERGRSMVISGDTGEDEALEEFACDTSLLVLECSFPEGEGIEGHLTPSEAGKLASRAQAKRLLLTHFYPACDGKELLVPCQAVFDGEVLLAHDWMRVAI